MVFQTCSPDDPEVEQPTVWAVSHEAKMSMWAWRARRKEVSLEPGSRAGAGADLGRRSAHHCRECFPGSASPVLFLEKMSLERKQASHPWYRGPS